MEKQSAHKYKNVKPNMPGQSNDGDSMVSADVTEGGTSCDWHYNACYDHYWKQYSRIASWIRNCQQNFTSSSFKPDFSEWCRLMCQYHATMATYMQWNYLSAVTASPQYLDCNWSAAAFAQNPMQSRLPMSVPSSKFHRKCGRGRKRRRQRSRARKQHLFSSAGDIELHIANIDPDGDGLDVELGEGGENFEFEFEITEDLLEFFAETARHRKQRELMKAAQLTQAMNVETTNEDLCSETAVRIQPTILPPSEQLGARRLAEMQELYGAGAAMIHGMETAMQLSFDRNTDRHKPRPWPALPLNIQFN